MLNSTQKRRNLFKEGSFEEIKSYGLKHDERPSLLTQFQSHKMLKERALNRSCIYHFNNSQPDDQKSQKSCYVFPLRAGMQLQQGKFVKLSKKMKEFLEAEGKENIKTGTIDKPEEVKKSSRKSKITQKQQVKTPYFIECLQRKSQVYQQVCMHISASIFTFKQYSKLIEAIGHQHPDSQIPPENQKKKTIVFDMDETLIHTSQDYLPHYEFRVPFRSCKGKIVQGYVAVRPHARQILKNLSKHFDLIVFTAGCQQYADSILDQLDPHGCIQHRLYRQSCTQIGQLFVKDLRILGRKLERVVLIDNAPHSYLLQPMNGIPILSYLKGKQDDQLFRLEEYLMELKEVEDVRSANHQTFRLVQYVKFQKIDELVTTLYGKWL